jgi:hypothetical protein
MVARWSEAPPASDDRRARVSAAACRASAAAGSTQGSLRGGRQAGWTPQRPHTWSLQQHSTSKGPALPSPGMMQRQRQPLAARWEADQTYRPCAKPSQPGTACTPPPSNTHPHPPVGHAAGHRQHWVQAGEEAGVEQHLAQRRGQRQRRQVPPQAGQVLPLIQRPNVLQQLNTIARGGETAVTQGRAAPDRLHSAAALAALLERRASNAR